MSNSETGRGRVRVLWLGACLLMACNPGGTGALRVLASGEEGAKRGFASTELADGWSIQFDRYLVSLSGLRLEQDGASVADPLASAKVLDLTRGAQELIRLENLPAGRLALSYAVLPPGDDAIAGEGVDAAVLEEMRAERWSYLLEGTATKPPYAPVRFRLGFSEGARMEDCTNGVDGTQGIVIPASSEAEAELTLHVEHLFYDKLGTHVGVQLRFEAIAAMAPEAGTLHLEDLAAQSVLEPVGMDGARLVDEDGAPVVYDPGAYSVTTLEDFLRVSIRDQAHLNGGGLCTVVQPD